ncbi:UDP-N-acetylmuramate dehydrogenase [Halomonas shantousis]
MQVVEADLSQANTLGLTCKADHFIAAHSPGEVRQALRLAKESDWPVTVLGGGSNMLLPPRLKGLVLQPAFAEWRIEPAREGNVLVHADAGVSWHALVMALAERDLWGVENLALIPGHVGAAPIQNIGAYGVELSDVLEAVHFVHRDDGRERVLTMEECAFGYRDSVFKHALANRVVITRLVLRMSTTPRPQLEYGALHERVPSHPTPLQVAQAVCDVRQEKLPDPRRLGNVGSFFKNPLVTAEQAEALLARYPAMPHFPQADGQVKLAAAWLIDQCGFKGLRDGCFGVHDRQALVLVHHGQGRVEELLALAERIVAAVAGRFGVRLEREPQCVVET